MTRPLPAKYGPNHEVGALRGQPRFTWGRFERGSINPRSACAGSTVTGVVLRVALADMGKVEAAKAGWLGRRRRPECPSWSWIQMCNQAWDNTFGVVADRGTGDPAGASGVVLEVTNGGGRAMTSLTDVGALAAPWRSGKGACSPTAAI